ncbi:hypothetical protein pqer_cds_1097 [Pandoravirus quercus]|uniref:Uncharacterized protein n=1 Tax=Pandoravirus quercus TaxID=2107709 RepID=A0A2U7UAQ8_9VIRU|nr:hypothetical protein pqer_cds_1097 [Pandoravirus quercus]AVK75519.1 hypothetical protein pqer_cds_1097 [Pandoravirus quercus]
MATTTQPIPMRPARRDGDCDCDGPVCRTLLTLLFTTLFLLGAFALYSAFHGAHDANDYYANCVRLASARQAGPQCADSTDPDCVLAPQRTCAISTFAFIMASIFLWVFYVAILPVVGPFALYDWIVATLS